MVNSAYLANQNNYPVQFSTKTLYLNGVFLNPLESNIYLQNSLSESSVSKLYERSTVRGFPGKDQTAI